MDIDPLEVLRDGAGRFALVSFRKMLYEMVEHDHPHGTVHVGEWWCKNLENYLRDGTLPKKRSTAA